MLTMLFEISNIPLRESPYGEMRAYRHKKGNLCSAYLCIPSVCECISPPNSGLIEIIHIGSEFENDLDRRTDYTVIKNTGTNELLPPLFH